MNNVNDLSSNGWVLPAEMLRGLFFIFSLLALKVISCKLFISNETQAESEMLELIGQPIRQTFRKI